MAENFLRVTVDRHMTLKFPCRVGEVNGRLKNFLLVQDSLTPLLGNGMACALEQESILKWMGEIVALCPENGEVTIQILQRGGK